jgi:hypothetical protein
MNGLRVYAELGAELGERLGRAYEPVECYRCADAEVCFVMIGSFATKAKAAVDALRAAGQAVGLGGRDIADDELFEIARVTAEAGALGRAPPPRLLYTAGELRELRTLQTLAHVERNSLGGAR